MSNIYRDIVGGGNTGLGFGAPTLGFGAPTLGVGEGW